MITLPFVPVSTVSLYSPESKVSSYQLGGRRWEIHRNEASLIVRYVGCNTTTLPVDFHIAVSDSGLLRAFVYCDGSLSIDAPIEGEALQRALPHRILFELKFLVHERRRRCGLTR